MPTLWPAAKQDFSATAKPSSESSPLLSKSTATWTVNVSPARNGGASYRSTHVDENNEAQPDTNTQPSTSSKHSRVTAVLSALALTATAALAVSLCAYLYADPAHESVPTSADGATAVFPGSLSHVHHWSVTPATPALTPADVGAYSADAKGLVTEMDTLIGHQFRWDDWDSWHPVMNQFFAEGFTYDFSYPAERDPNPCTLCSLKIPGTRDDLQPGDAPYHGIKSWWSGEHIPWNQAFPKTLFAVTTGFILAGGDEYVTMLTYAWSNFTADFKDIPQRLTEARAKELGVAPGDPYPVMLVDMDFWRIGHDHTSGEPRILHNWCDADTYGMMVQSGRRLLEHVGLPEGLWYPPRTMSGIPAPFTIFTSPALTAAAYGAARAMFEGVLLGNRQRQLFAPDAAFHFNPFGIGRAVGRDQIVGKVLKPLLWDAFADAKLSFDAVVCEGPICGAHGQLLGRHVKPFMGLAPTSTKDVKGLRFGCHLNLVAHEQPNGQEKVASKQGPLHSDDLLILDGYCMFDLLTAAWDLAHRDLIEEARAWD